MTEQRPKKVRRDTAAVRAQAELLLRQRHPERAVTTPWVREPDPDALQDVPTHTAHEIGMPGL